jgi:hypothetical protein
MPAILATREAEAGGFLVSGQLGTKSSYQPFVKKRIQTKGLGI